MTKVRKIIDCLSKMPHRKNNRAGVLDRTKVDIEGKYFAFLYSADYTEDGEAMEIFQVRKGKLEEIWHPSDHIPCLTSVIGELETDKAIAYLKKNCIKEIYTLGMPPRQDPYKFLGLNLDYYENKDSWHKHESLDDLAYWKSKLGDDGIELKVYNAS